MKKIILGYFILFTVTLFSDAWLTGYKYRIELLVPEKKDNFPVEQACILKINCPAKEDGSDIRITDENGKEIPFFPVRSGPGNFYELCFPADGKKFFLFCGNPDTQLSKSDYRPKRGVLLELYRINDRYIDTWESCKKIIDASIRKENLAGATFRKNIFDASNPLTQSGYFLRVYTGYFYLNQKKKISFGTTSSSASFILVDDRIVASWPGKHWVKRFIRPEHSGTVELEQGLHKIVYYHFELPGWVYAVCAMKRTNDEKFEVMDENFFLPVLEAKINRVEKLNSSVCASFNWENTNYLYREKWELLTFQFTDTSSGKNNIVYWYWNFGDGQTSNKKNPVHTYFLKKPYEVTLTVKDDRGNSDTVTMKVMAEQDYSKLVLPARTTQQYLEEFSRFDIAKLPDEELFALAGIYSSYDVNEKEFECYNELLKRNQEQQQWFKIAFIAADIATKIGKFAEAESIYKKILEKENLPEARLKLGQIYLETDQLDNAEKQFNALVSDTKTESRIKKAATIGLGDIKRYRADRINALRFYESVTADTDIKRKSGMFYQMASFYLKKNDFPTAIEKIAQWAEEIPVCKMNGNWSILYARAYLGLKDYARSLKEIETFIRISKPDDPYYGWALYWKGEIYLEKGEKENAKTVFSEIIEKFPQTRIAEMAGIKLQETEK